MTDQFTPPTPPPAGAPGIPGAEPQPLGSAAAPTAEPTTGSAAPVPVRTAGGVAQAPAAWWALLRALYSGDPARFTDAALRPPSGRSTHWTWVFASVVNGALVGLAVVLLMARVSSELGFFFAPDGGDYLSAFVLPIVCSVALVLARAGAVAALFAVRRRTIAFTDAAALASTAFVVAAPALALMLVLSLLPGSFALVVLTLAGTFTVFYAELALYIAVARAGRFERSPALPHAALSAAWLCLMSFIAGTVVTDVAADLLGALGGVL